MFRAHTAVLPALTNTHLLMGSIQAELKSAEWDYGWWGRPRLKARAGERTRRWTALVEQFRAEAEAVPPSADPLKSVKRAIASSPAIRRKVRARPDSIYETVAELRALRADYDADAARSAAIRAHAALRDVGRAAGKAEPAAVHARLLDRARVIRAELDLLMSEMREGLPDRNKDAKDEAGRERIIRSLAALGEDAQCLDTELDRLSMLFLVDAYLKKTGIGPGRGGKR